MGSWTVHRPTCDWKLVEKSNFSAKKKKKKSINANVCLGSAKHASQMYPTSKICKIVCDFSNTLTKKITIIMVTTTWACWLGLQAGSCCD